MERGEKGFETERKPKGERGLNGVLVGPILLVNLDRRERPWDQREGLEEPSIRRIAEG